MTSFSLFFSTGHYQIQTSEALCWVLFSSGLGVKYFSMLNMHIKHLERKVLKSVARKSFL